MPKKRATKSKKGINPKLAIWILASLCLITLLFCISMFFTSAVITIKPKIQELALNAEVFPIKLRSAAVQDLPFDTITIIKNNSRIVESAGEKKAEIKATGRVNIYNTYSETEQKLIAGTRIATKEGKIYRLDQAVTIPGMKKNNEQIIPGIISANITADQAGASYNKKIATSSPTTDVLRVIGFKGTPKYTGFYAVVSEDITGGFIGLKKLISPEKEKELITEYQDDLKKLLLADLRTSTGDSLLSFDNLNYFEYSKLQQENDEAGVKVTMKASLNSLVLFKSKLASYLAIQKITSYNKLPVDIILPTDFSVNLISTSTTPWLEKNLDISLTGKGTIVWKYDVEKIKEDLIGKNIFSLSAVRSKYLDSVSDLKIRLTPFWQIFLPDDISRIMVEKN